MPGKKGGKDLTPAMRQFVRFKKQYPNCVLFFRMGDFYEMFYDDAKLAHKVLGITLTQRTEGVPMAGVPYHAVENYLRRMILAGYRVAVCDQVEDPKQAKGVVDRDVTRVVTPGTLTDEVLLEEASENPLAAVMFHDDSSASLAWAELSTGAFAVATLGGQELSDELGRIAPRELLYVETANGETPRRVQRLIDAVRCASTPRPAWQFRQGEAIETLQRQFQVKTLEGFGFGNDDASLGPASAVVHYLLETQCSQGRGPRAEGRDMGDDALARRIAHLRPPRRFDRRNYLIIDQVSLHSLEVERTIRTGETRGSVLGVLSDCRTAMGKRMLRHWLCYPLCHREPIERRQRVVAALVEDATFLDALRGALDDVQDVARIIARIGVGRATPRDLVALGTSAMQVGVLTQLLADRPSVQSHHEQLDRVAAPLTELAEAIAAACVEAPPGHLRDGGLIRDGYDTPLDECRALQRDSNAWLAGYQKQLIEQTGIANVKVGYNKVFGFYIELTAANRDRAPAQWTRKQTLKNAERFITPQLKEYEGKVLSADQRAVAREQALFARLCDKAQDYLVHLHEFGEAVGEVDVLACFARRAVRHRYVRPRIVEQPVLNIRGGRHPVLDELLADRFVPNDMRLGGGEGDNASLEGKASSLALITGPNMAGKSTYIRQAALITLLAHTGGFVPADEATVGLCDRIFTRIGASDELHTGQSTFMIEMTETANICHHATPSSLIVLDEIGRGTSTLDGLSLAWAIAEHLVAQKCRTLFATHYHELTALAQRYDNVTNLTVTVREWQDQIVFIYRIVPGATDRSYGIHVAKIAGLPATVVDRANELLAQLEVSHNAANGRPGPASPADGQLSLFTEYVEHPAIAELRELDLTSLTPLGAFDALRRIRRSLDESSD